jgi:glycosyltransferase involved in cell wall biosynthesis
MRILFVVQRYGVEVAGGAEQHCRWLAESFVKLGHQADVLTSCALDYMTWSTHYSEGTEDVNGVLVHRLGLLRERDVVAFNDLSQKLDFVAHSTDLELEREWLLAQGPLLKGIDNWFDRNLTAYDVVVPFTYLYATAQATIDNVSGRKPIVMHATAHDEPPFFLREIQRRLKKVDGFLCSTPEEQKLLSDALPSAMTFVVGIGIELATARNIDLVREELSIPTAPYFVVLGRIDGNKGTPEAIELFRNWRGATNSEVNLLVVGSQSEAVNLKTQIEGVIFTGFVDEATKSALIENAIALIQPSKFESFSMVMCESWLSGTPTISDGTSDVVRGQTRRSKGGVIYTNQSEFNDALSDISKNPHLRRFYGSNGKHYVRAHYLTSDVSTRIVEILADISSSDPKYPLKSCYKMKRKLCTLLYRYRKFPHEVF